MSSSANKDSAAQAYTLGVRALKRKDFDSAIKYLKKSLKYHSTREAQDLLSSAESLKSIHEYQKNKKHRRQSRSSVQYQRPQEEKVDSNVSDPEIRRVLNETDYYTLLGVGEDACDEKNLTKKYRKLAMKFHPDRNNLPGAEDAFKKIASAYECLKDPQKRQLYDQYGTDAPELRQMNNQFDHMHPEDILRMFFQNRGTPFPFNNRNFCQGQQHPHPQDASALNKLISFLPILLIVLYSLLHSSATDDFVPFSLERTLEYSVVRHHSTEDIRFYVDRSFERRVRTRPNFLQTVEDLVEGRYLQKIYNECHKELEERTDRIAEASKVRGADMVKTLRAAYEKVDRSCLLLDKYIKKTT